MGRLRARHVLIVSLGSHINVLLVQALVDVLKTEDLLGQVLTGKLQQPVELALFSLKLIQIVIRVGVLNSSADVRCHRLADLGCRCLRRHMIKSRIAPRVLILTLI